jgi:hypothetical protein
VQWVPKRHCYGRKDLLFNCINDLKFLWDVVRINYICTSSRDTEGKLVSPSPSPSGTEEHHEVNAPVVSQVNYTKLSVKEVL